MSLIKFILDNLIIGSTESFSCNCGGSTKSPEEFVAIFLIFMLIFAVTSMIFNYSSLAGRLSVKGFIYNVTPYIIITLYELLTYSLLSLLFLQFHAAVVIILTIAYIIFRIIRAAILEAGIFGITRSLASYTNNLYRHSKKVNGHKQHYLTYRKQTF